MKALSAQGVKLRVLGVLHSWSNVFADDGSHVMFLDNFKSIIQDPNDYTVVTLQVGPSAIRLRPAPPPTTRPNRVESTSIHT